MTELPKRELGRTGLEVTMLGYGAMSCAARRAPATSVKPKPKRSSTQCSIPGSTTLTRRSITGSARSASAATSGIGARVLSREQMRLPGRRAAGAARRPQSACVHPENIIAGVEQSLRRMQTDHLDVVQFHSSPSQRTLRKWRGRCGA